MDRRTFIKSGLALSAMPAIAQVEAIAALGTFEATVVCSTIFAGATWVVYEHEPQTVYRIDEDIEFKRGDRVLLAG